MQQKVSRIKNEEYETKKKIGWTIYWQNKKKVFIEDKTTSSTGDGKAR